MAKGTVQVEFDETLTDLDAALDPSNYTVRIPAPSATAGWEDTYLAVKKVTVVTGTTLPNSKFDLDIWPIPNSYPNNAYVTATNMTSASGLTETQTFTLAPWTISDLDIPRFGFDWHAVDAGKPQGVIEAVIGAVGSVFQKIAGRATTKITQHYAASDNQLVVESTLDFPSKGTIWVGGRKINYTFKSDASFKSVITQLNPGFVGEPVGTTVVLDDTKVDPLPKDWVTTKFPLKSTAG